MEDKINRENFKQEFLKLYKEDIKTQDSLENHLEELENLRFDEKYCDFAAIVSDIHDSIRHQP